MTRASLNRSSGIPLHYANRHGLIVGPTGCGKSVSLMRLAEQFSHAGVPVFVSDVKTDLSALARSCPASLLDLFGRDGQAISVTFEAMGPDLISRALELSDVQSACVEIAFAYASATGARLDSIADFRSVLQSLQSNAKAVSTHYGQVSSASIGVVMRALLRLESQGGNSFFKAPCFDVAKLLQLDSGKGLVSILQAQTLINSPRLYSAFLLFLLSKLYDRMPEIGDVEKPRLVFFFDESHLLFQDCPPALLRRIEQTARLIRSKGVGVYFVTQRPDDIPEIIRSQLAHRLEHARALPVGTALFSTMTDSGKPLAPAAVKIDLPDCPLGPLTAIELPKPAAVPCQAAASGQTLGETIKDFGFAFYLVVTMLTCIVATICYGLYWTLSGGHSAAVAAACIGVWLAIRKRI